MIKCNNCKTDNRDIAKFCRECGTPLLSANPFLGLIAKDSIVKQLKNYVQRCKARKRIADKTGKEQSSQLGLDCIIIGDSGTGKNYLAELLRDIAFSEGVITKYEITTYDASEVDSLMNNLDTVLFHNSSGIIHITNAHKLVPNTAMTQVTIIDKLFLKMRQNKNMPIIFMSGQTDVLQPFAQKNPDIAKLFEYHFYLNPFDDLSMTELAKLKLTKLGISVSSEAETKMRQRFKYLCRNRDDSFGNGNDVEMEIQDYITNMVSRNGMLIEEGDIQGDIFVPKTEKDIFDELDGFIGLQEVKDEIHKIVNNLKSEKRSKGDGATLRIKDHYVFTGNPGTGKTTIARIFAELLNALDLLPSGQLVEVHRKDLVSEFIGGTAQKVEKVISKSIGGVLFIDEAYALKSDEQDPFGQEAIDTLLPILENRRGEFVCIIAGYTNEMDKFLESNSGLESRFNKRISFPDYNPEELTKIFYGLAKKDGLVISKEADERISKFFEKMYLSRNVNKFGNARDVRNVFQKAKERLNTRRTDMDDEELKTVGNVMEWQDIIGPENLKDLSVDDVMSEMDQFVGMGSVKKAIRELAVQMEYNKKISEAGRGKTSLTPVNIILTGNPGTGKTSVARILGKLFTAIGITSKDTVVEIERKDIVSGFINQSDKKMDDAINRAMGGVLFIDEAYNLAPVDEFGSCNDSEGRKALERLMTRMENDKGKFVLICAGYKEPMRQFLRVNPGLQRRFTHKIHIEDYSAEELLEIYIRFLKKEDYILADDFVRNKALKMFEAKVAGKDDSFGNAGEARNLFEQTKRNLANRIQANPALYTDKDWFIVLDEDIPYDEPESVDPDECLKELDKMIGLQSVKSSMRKLADTINREKKVAELSGKKPIISVGHYMFLGNPGTGKTTVARMMGKILYSMGVLKRPDVLEVDKSQLVAGYVGQSEKLTADVIRRAMGGVLFIDEAYELADGQFGKNSLDVLLKQLEDRRGDFVCIVAGYTNEMKGFINSNPGLKSRFPKENCLLFEDYNTDELYAIFEMFCKKEELIISDGASVKIKQKIQEMYDERDSKFGNARDIRELFNEIKGNLSRRTRCNDNSDLITLTTIEKEDVII